MITRVEVHSFGYLHGQPGAGLVIDLRHQLRDPHVNPEMRALTGLHPLVRDHVLMHPSALTTVRDIADQVMGLLDGFANRRSLLVHVWIGCQGGRHRSVVVAESVAAWLREHDIGVDVVHEHIDRPVVERRGDR
ncbi:RNase adapter RapZ [Micromonospora sp. FIMYZ51]|uniref:RapZ C-terminal domain-containing protein n=1 Tax=Micromonospora sp. FIMYZ51 TaxID=3051832 RepID=UPI00311DAAB8